ncbi:MAG: hypothetical protein DRI86_06395 [Bacteroidetes bacterium]|nr:MAG: hypothetical protein DRI86_06395 [Bacteroidota bacterium]
MNNYSSIKSILIAITTLIVINASSQNHYSIFKTYTYEMKVNSKIVRTTTEELLLDSNVVYDLHNPGTWIRNFRLVASEKYKVLLSFNHPSSIEPFGICGAGNEEGFMLYQFDKNYKLISSKSILLESCVYQINVESKVEISNYITKYIISDDSEDAYFEVVINAKDVWIGKSKIKNYKTKK